ncbi:MAG: 4Fe-4S dicluster domain-containing protein [Anaerolineae bacterium]|nr:4Fe-4S dicluster domain-containing protein [Anaerolineae bacterium]
MDQNRLRELEEQCIQEHAPACQAGCPVHVDGRGLAVEVGRGDFAAALKILRKSIPFPAIIGRICDQPCRLVCRRAEAGQAINIAALERASVDWGGPFEPVPVLPRKSKRVAVAGSDLSALTVAFDLTKKGYTVSVFEKNEKAGGSLWNLPETLLPRNLINDEITRLEHMGVEFILKTPITAFEKGDENAPFNIEGRIYDAVYIADGDLDAARAWLEFDTFNAVVIDPVTLASRCCEGVFAGGGAVQARDVAMAGGSRLPRSAIRTLAEGRRAAVSLDRYLQRVSLTAARVNEGVYTTRLFTSLEGVQDLPQVKMSQPELGYNREEAQAEGQRCIQCQCLECVKVCEYLKQYGSYPKRYVREIYNNLSIVSGTRQKNQFINSCSLCGLCGEVCPEDLNMAGVCLEARQTMVKTKRMPPSAFDFALRDMAFSNGEDFALARNQPGSQHSDYVFFPGCQLGASYPDAVEKMYAYLLSRSGNELNGKIGLMLRCCGAQAEWAGRSDLFEASQNEFLSEYERLGAPELILACSSCYRIFKTYYPQVKISSLWTLLDRLGLPDDKNITGEGKTITIQDPCSTRYEPEIQDSVRRILNRLGYQINELTLSREKTECCSYGGLMWLSNRKLAADVINKRIVLSPLDYLTYCVMCRDFFASEGKASMYLLDVLFDPAGAQARALIKGPGYSTRHENRARLKKRLLKTFWGEDMQNNRAYETIRLNLSESVLALMESRLILVEDVQQVIEYAERTGRRLLNRQSGRYLAYYCPNTVTYWVEYLPENEAYTIFNTYSHRMVIEEAGRS